MAHAAKFDPRSTGGGAMTTVKGWCPGAYTPMMSGDGLIVRVRPRMGQLSAVQAQGICAAAERFGNGLIDLTSRANVQLRGVAQSDHPALLETLGTLGLLDANPVIEARRNILTTPDWQDGDLTTRLYAALYDRLGELPDLPAKMGIALDTGRTALLQNSSADFRFEIDNTGGLILRADGMDRGQPVTEASAADALIEMTHWFVATASGETRRMAQLVARQRPRRSPHCSQPRPAGTPLVPGHGPLGQVFGAAFGSLMAQDLKALIADTRASALRCTPWRLIILDTAQAGPANGLVTDPADPLLRSHACPGAPACSAATVDTRALARALTAKGAGSVHVSGCVKGCAHPGRATLTVVGRDGAYGLVKKGHAWDQPQMRGLTADALLALDLMTLSD